MRISEQNIKYVTFYLNINKHGKPSIVQKFRCEHVHYIFM